MPDAAPALRTLAQHRLFWPALHAGAAAGGQRRVQPGFLALQWRDGHLYGSLIDILNRAAPLMLVALGMTLVIATRGIDISVGAVVAIAAAVAALLIGGTLDRRGRRADLRQPHADGPGDRRPRSRWRALCGLWNGLLVAKVGMQPIIATLILMVAGRGIAQLITDGQIITIYYAPYFFIGNGYLLGPAVRGVASSPRCWLALHLADDAHGAGPVHPGHRHQPGGGAAGRAAATRLITVCVYVFCGLTAGVAGLIDQLQRQERRRQQRRPAARARRHPGGRRSAAPRSPADASASRGSVLGALIIQTLTSTIYSIGVPPEVNLVVKAVVVFA